MNTTLGFVELKSVGIGMGLESEVFNASVVLIDRYN
jgi:hypothetical protein